jgi:hypothetical protein
VDGRETIIDVASEEEVLSEHENSQVLSNPATRTPFVPRCASLKRRPSTLENESKQRHLDSEPHKAFPQLTSQVQFVELDGYAADTEDFELPSLPKVKTDMFENAVMGGFPEVGTAHLQVQEHQHIHLASSLQQIHTSESGLNGGNAQATELFDISNASTAQPTGNQLVDSPPYAMSGNLFIPVTQSQLSESSRDASIALEPLKAGVHARLPSVDHLADSRASAIHVHVPNEVAGTDSVESDLDMYLVESWERWEIPWASPTEVLERKRMAERAMTIERAKGSMVIDLTRD